MKTYWISFANDDGCLGCIITDGENEQDAMKSIKHINPGGEAMFIEWPENAPKDEIDKWGKNVLISEEDLLNGGYKKLKDLPDDMMNNSGLVSTICEKHNEEQRDN